MKNKEKFPFKHGDVVSFEDTDSEYVDVGFGVHCGVKVAEAKYENVAVVRKWGRGFRLELDGYGSETFSTRRVGDKSYVSLRDVLDYFGDYSSLKYIGKEEDINRPFSEIEEKWVTLWEYLHSTDDVTTYTLDFEGEKICIAPNGGAKNYT